VLIFGNFAVCTTNSTTEVVAAFATMHEQWGD